MLRAVYGGRTVWTGEAHRFGVSEVELVAAKAMPAIPGGAALFCDCPESGPGGRLAGYVTAILPSKMERWIVRFAPADAALSDAQAVADVEAAVAQAAPAAFPGTPIARLRPLSAARTWAAIKDAAATVEEVAAMSDEALLVLSGVGTKSLEEIRRAVDAVLTEVMDAGL